jgi:pyruvate/2-oxoglutarate dehydrogenase complex dihydrolipoamide acyltransferase (E2) component
MARECKVPALGETVKSATVSKVLIARGDVVKREQPVVELEADKAVLEVPADVEGTVEEIRVREGDTVVVGQTLFTVRDA